MAQVDDILLQEELALRPPSGYLFKRLAAYLRPYRKTVVWTLLATALAVASQLLGPKFIQIGIDRYLTHFKSEAEAYHGILVISVIYLGNLLLGWFVTVAQVRSAVFAGESAVNDLREDIFKHIQRLSLNYFDKTHQGRIIARADTDLNTLGELMTWGGTQLLSSFVTLLGVIALMLQYDWRLCLAVSLVIPPLIIATMLFQKYGMEAYREVRSQSSRLTAALAENITGVRVVQAMARQELNFSRFQTLHEIYGQKALTSARIFHTYMPFIGLVSAIGVTIILSYGGRLALRGEISPGEAGGLHHVCGHVLRPNPGDGRSLQSGALWPSAGAERVFELLDTEPQIINRPQASPLPTLEGQVAFENIYFRYDTTAQERWILQGVSFEAKPGQTVALVGATGSGKTSIISLLARFYEPQQGRILVDGHNLAHSTIESLHEQIGIVTQENFLFTGTVMENLKFGRPEATDDEVIAAAKTLGTHDIILGLSEGYQTKVAERGGNFSAGERQLISFTRAMVAQPRILILDEATSAVDPRAEEVIQHALEQLFARRTCFVIAHRLSTVVHADQILVLRNGEIIERGTHVELLQLGAEYRRLYDEFTRH
ncbi:MAG: ABC transporter ATP-binding protein [Chthoniobacteraceae bacterium]